MLSVTCVNWGGFFFFQAEDGIRDIGVTGVQTCALPISARTANPARCKAKQDRRPSPARSRWAAEMDGCPRQNPAYRLANEEAPLGGLFYVRRGFAELWPA